MGNHISKKAELLSRLTACQSTLTINDTSITKFEKNEMINKVFGNSIQNSFKSFDFLRKMKMILLDVLHQIMDMKKNLDVHIKEKYI